MKQVVAALMVVVAAFAIAHEGGHGLKLTDAAKQGGLVAPVVEAKDAKLGTKAAMVYKAELVRSEDGSLRVFLYDAQMNALKLDGFEKTATAVLATFGKRPKKATFDLKLEGDAFAGAAPKASRKPFNIEVTMKEKDKSLLVAFDNLD